MRRRLGFIIVTALAVMPLGVSDAAGQPPTVVAAEAQHDLSPALSTIPAIAPRGDEQRIHPVRRLPLPESRGDEADPQLQRQATRRLRVTKPQAFDGIGDGIPAFSVGGAPSDTTGAAGPEHYVQWVNTAFAVYEKKSGKLVYGPAAGNTLWSNFGGACQKLNDGDPIVLYDRLAGRWLLSQFAVDGGPPYFQCVAISTGPNPLGTYARYAFRYDDFNDYPKFGVWPDAYYVTYNMFKGNDFAGAKTCALERDKMLQGAAARMICADVPEGGLLPSDLDGTTPPPPNTPNFVVNFGPNSLNVWRFAVNWNNPAASTFAGPERILVGAFRPACDGGGCIPQPGAANSTLDSLADRLMYRAAYRNFGAHTSLVVNHSVNVALPQNQSTSGVRWYELRGLETSPTVHQQGTFAPDATARWMGGIAMDKAGNMLLGYSASGRKVHPSIRITGRAASDPLNTLSSEMIVAAGNGTQSISRWGDYSSLTLDPVDDCTFWFSTQYVRRDGDFVWRTRFARMKFENCK